MEGKITEPLKIPPEPVPEYVTRLFAEHGCTLTQTATHIALTVPAGATRKEILPRLTCERYQLIFPDGWTLHEQRDWNGLSYLSIPVSGRAEE